MNPRAKLKPLAPGAYHCRLFRVIRFSVNGYRLRRSRKHRTIVFRHLPILCEVQPPAMRLRTLARANRPEVERIEHMWRAVPRLLVEDIWIARIKRPLILDRLHLPRIEDSNRACLLIEDTINALFLQLLVQFRDELVTILYRIRIIVTRRAKFMPARDFAIALRIRLRRDRVLHAKIHRHHLRMLPLPAILRAARRRVRSTFREREIELPLSPAHAHLTAGLVLRFLRIEHADPIRRRTVISDAWRTIRVHDLAVTEPRYKSRRKSFARHLPIPLHLCLVKIHHAVLQIRAIGCVTVLVDVRLMQKILDPAQRIAYTDGRKRVAFSSVNTGILRRFLLAVWAALLFCCINFVERRLPLVDFQIPVHILRNENQRFHLPVDFYRHDETIELIDAVLARLRFFLRPLHPVRRFRLRVWDDFHEIRMPDDRFEIRQCRIACRTVGRIGRRSAPNQMRFPVLVLGDTDLRLKICRRNRLLRQILFDIVQDFLRAFPAQGIVHRVEVEYRDLLVERQVCFRHRLRIRRPARTVLAHGIEAEAPAVVVQRCVLRARLLRHLPRENIRMPSKDHRAHACRLCRPCRRLLEPVREVLVHLERLARHAARQLHLDAVEAAHRALHAVERREILLQRLDDGPRLLHRRLRLRVRHDPALDLRRARVARRERDGHVLELRRRRRAFVHRPEILVPRTVF